MAEATGEPDLLAPAGARLELPTVVPVAALHRRPQPGRRPSERTGHRRAQVAPDRLTLLMLRHPSFTVEPPGACAKRAGLDLLAQSESVFALSNGHIGWRGNLDEGEPNGMPGSYLNGVYEQRPLPYAEVGYGYPEDGQTIINVTNGM